MTKKVALLITCEHGGNRVPAKFRHLFANDTLVHQTHRGFDPGALQLARRIVLSCKCDHVYETVSRLLIEQNRSSNSKSIFSEFSNKLTSKEKKYLIENYYDPYHQKVNHHITLNRDNSLHTVHLSIHTFTPVLDDKIRTADVGLLYDPSRSNEVKFVTMLRSMLIDSVPAICVRRNYPYKGTSDGLTTSLRKCYSNRDYTGIEIEINQKHFISSTKMWDDLMDKFSKYISTIMQ